MDGTVASSECTRRVWGENSKSKIKGFVETTHFGIEHVYSQCLAAATDVMPHDV